LTGMVLVWGLIRMIWKSFQKTPPIRGKDWKSCGLRWKYYSRWGFCFQSGSIIIFEKTVANKALRGNSPQNPPHEGSTAGSCVSAIVCNHFLHIHNIELAFSQWVVEKLWILAVEKLDLYEWFWRRIL
jgi:hypothetical protein